jgi:hypothetical protein
MTDLNNLLTKDMSKSKTSFKDITYNQKRIYIMPCNFLIGFSLPNDHEHGQPHVFTGIMNLNEDCQQPPYGLSMMVTEQNKENLLVFFSDCDIVIIKLLKVNFGLFEFLLWKVEEGVIESNTQIVIISSPLLWSENCSSNNVNVITKKLVSPKEMHHKTPPENDHFNGFIFNETDFENRKCLPCFELLRLWRISFLKWMKKLVI